MDAARRALWAEYWPQCLCCDQHVRGLEEQGPRGLSLGDTQPTWRKASCSEKRVEGSVMGLVERDGNTSGGGWEGRPGPCVQVLTH